MLRAFPRTPINIEIKGRTKKEAVGEYVRSAEVLARLLKDSERRDLIVEGPRGDGGPPRAILPGCASHG